MDSCDSRSRANKHDVMIISKGRPEEQFSLSIRKRTDRR